MSDARDDSTGESRVPIAAEGTASEPHAHLAPLVAAEIGWGNRVLAKWGRSDPLLDDRSLSFLYPLHVDALRRTFGFPPNIKLYAIMPRPGHPREKARLLLTDTDRYVTIHSPLPKDWPYGEGEIAL
ncbi:hypothetical protein ABZ901_33425 [Actinacidiphila alni]|uniref:hypothetical protein n=1 Tax=Actinacidiphila alni TaxID=380248 RepID=UPI0033DC965A